MKKFLIIVAAIITAFVVLAVGCTALVSSSLEGEDDDTPNLVVDTPASSPTDKKNNKSTTKPSAKSSESSVACANHEDKNKPCEIKLGQSFVLGKHQVLKGWKIKADFIDDVEMTGKAKNVGDEESTMFITVKFLSGTEIVINIDCSTDALEAGQTQAISCYSSDDFTKKYDKITVEATF